MASLTVEKFSPLHVNRLDSVLMHPCHRARAKVMMQQAEVFAELVAAVCAHLLHGTASLTRALVALRARRGPPLSHAERQ